VGVGFRVLCRAGNLTIGIEQKRAPGEQVRTQVPAPTAQSEILGHTLELLNQDAVATAALNLRAFLHEAHARQDPGGLFQMLQIVSRKVGTGQGSIRTLP
jgi:hypothetical protein